MSQRIAWIDCWKGIAIITVVVSHIVEPVSKYLFWFHMPLFFFMSGYLYKNKYDYFTFFKRKFFHLLIPYVSFLVLFSSREYVSYILNILQQRRNDLINEIFKFTFDLMYGGQNLTGSFGIFWFITCLFFTQQLYNFLYSKFGTNRPVMIIIMLTSYSLAMINFWFMANVSFPWSINVVAMALPFYWIGHMAASSSINYVKGAILSVIILVAAFVIDWTVLDLTFNMKYIRYGILIFNVVIALAGIIVTQQLAKIIHKKNSLGNALSEIGKASMIIMYLHQIIQLNMNKTPILSHITIRLIAGLLIPFIIYRIMSHYSIMRKFFLGEFTTQTVGATPDIPKI
jgi:fucose 4-O-acetylase-like acetyltransferase